MIQKTDRASGETIGLVACGGKKRLSPMPAKKLYLSPWFGKARRYAQGLDRWYILSAKYGLVEPSRPIAPYGQNIMRLPKPQREEWARGVFNSLCALTEPDDTIVMICGRYYRETLTDLLIARGNPVECPLEKLRFNAQKGWFNEQWDAKVEAHLRDRERK